jgi:two-component system sensor histidine kinase HydH
MNSIQAIGDKKGDITVEITDEPSDENVIIKVVDTGIGIREDIMEKIFDPLFTTKQVGTGLGLSSCKSIIDQHGGTISASSKIGRGTTFTIKIPKKSDWSAISKENTQNSLIA